MARARSFAPRLLNTLADAGYKITALDRVLRQALDTAQEARRRWRPGDWAFLTVPLQQTPGAANAPLELGPARFYLTPGEKPPPFNQMVQRGFRAVTIIDLGQIFQIIEELNQ